MNRDVSIFGDCARGVSLCLSTGYRVSYLSQIGDTVNGYRRARDSGEEKKARDLHICVPEYLLAQERLVSDERH